MVIGSFLKRNDLEWPSTRWLPFIHDAGGIEPLLQSISVATKASYQRLGIVLDADEDIAARWEAVGQRLRRTSIETPRALPAAGWVVDIPKAQSPGTLQRLGVWVMPDSQAAGELEDFVATLVPPGDPLWPHARQATGEAIALNAPLGIGKRAKGEVHAYLAWQKEPGVPMGAHSADSGVG